MLNNKKFISSLSDLILIRKFRLPFNCRRKMSESVRVRFGPSPTGFIHLGGLRTAFYNYLFAKQNNGSFILRIEDTDQDRVVDGSLENLEQMLDWTGLRPDEGPSSGGKYGPYIQSERKDLYKEKVDQLLASGRAYRCFCSDLRLELLRKEKLKNREIPKYDNKCRHLTNSEIKDKLSVGHPFTVRFRLKEGPIEFNDLVFGKMSLDLSAVESDPIIFKSDGFPTYHLANVVDDHYMKISHVLRGAEWQVSTPKHIMLYEAFGWKAPLFAHLPLIVNKDGTKLSKRQNDIRIDYYRDRGFYPQTLTNYLTQIGGGFTHRSEDRIDRLEDLVKDFDLNKLNVSNSKIDVEKLLLYNRFAIYWYLNNGLDNQLVEELKTLLINRFADSSIDCLNLDKNYLKSLISWSKERVYTLKDLLNDEFIYLWKVPDFNWNPKSIGSKEQIEIVLKSIIDLLENLDENQFDFNPKNIYDVLKQEFNENHSKSIKLKSFMKILRLSLTNLESGSPIGETLELLGRQKSVLYLKSALKFVESTQICTEQSV